MNEKSRFASRLKAAMEAAGHEPRPSVLEKEFNSRYWGRSVSFQAARGWLIGKAIPSQDKLQVIAEWLNVHPQALRFGEQAARNLRDNASVWTHGLSPQDRALIDALLALPVARRKLVGELIKALASSG